MIRFLALSATLAIAFLPPAGLRAQPAEGAPDPLLVPDATIRVTACPGGDCGLKLTALGRLLSLDAALLRLWTDAPPELMSDGSRGTVGPGPYDVVELVSDSLRITGGAETRWVRAATGWSMVDGILLIPPASATRVMVATPGPPRRAAGALLGALVGGVAGASFVAGTGGEEGNAAGTGPLMFVVAATGAGFGLVLGVIIGSARRGLRWVDATAELDAAVRAPARLPDRR